ncbi:MAG: hypothetical protein A3F46_02610 [Legionellales bacterium RIFCSPHIGHO2_12_FULL_42_9]|nr:MAG: hypothetical protein A3F46_02610 [Legionellales bacterium RIFCSPHIGHO2_12_FULL_42_9]
MLFLDTLLTAPFKGLLAIFEEVQHAVDEEIEQNIADIKQELVDLYTRLESGSISEAEFDQQEKLLLDKLDDLEGDED